MNPTRELLAAWGHWLWQQNMAVGLGIRISSAYSMVPPGGYGDDRTPETDPAVLRVDKIIRSQLLRPEQRGVLIIHYTRRAKADDNAKSLEMSRRQYFLLLDNAILQLEHYLSTPEHMLT